MSDTNASTDKPLENLAAAKDVIDPPATEQAEPMTAEGRLRAFEDEHFGKEAVRINGNIERGSGSPYQDAKPEIRKQHIALTALIAAEGKLNDAKGALAQAEADYADAAKACDAAGE
jgi:hypothetical protein